MRLQALVLGIVLAVMASPAPAQRAPVFMQIADPQMGMILNDHGSQPEIRNLTAVVEEAERLHPAFVVVCGDLVNNNQNAVELQAFHHTIGQLKGVPLHLVPGNHDVGNLPTPAQIAAYRARYGPDYYTFDSGPLIGVVLDSMLMADTADPQDSALQLAWLKTALQRASARPGKQIAVFQHIPFFVHTPDEPNGYWNIPLQQRAVYLGLLHQYSVAYVFAGHLHYPVDGEGDGLEVVTVGATGKPLHHSVSGINLVQINLGGPWPHHFFPLTALPTQLQPPW
ncbi:MAG TPA: metallophosphoesterase [Terriglobales bacterium]|nr:metallophosphoesterase [Terriglobales bacterium]